MRIEEISQMGVRGGEREKTDRSSRNHIMKILLPMRKIISLSLVYGRRISLDVNMLVLRKSSTLGEVDRFWIHFFEQCICNAWLSDGNV